MHDSKDRAYASHRAVKTMAMDHCTVIGTLAVDGWAVTFGTAWVGCALAQFPFR